MASRINTIHDRAEVLFGADTVSLYFVPADSDGRRAADMAIQMSRNPKLKDADRNVALLRKFAALWDQERANQNFDEYAANVHSQGYLASDR